MVPDSLTTKLRDNPSWATTLCLQCSKLLGFPGHYVWLSLNTGNWKEMGQAWCMTPQPLWNLSWQQQMGVNASPMCWNRLWRQTVKEKQATSMQLRGITIPRVALGSVNDLGRFTIGLMEQLKTLNLQRYNDGHWGFLCAHDWCVWSISLGLSTSTTGSSSFLRSHTNTNLQECLGSQDRCSFLSP